MSITKSVWVENDPRYADVRQRYNDAAREAKSQFLFRIGLRRRGAQGRPHWEPAWPYCVNEAVTTLGFETIQLNSGLYFRTQDELDQAKKLAESLFDQFDLA